MLDVNYISEDNEKISFSGVLNFFDQIVTDFPDTSFELQYLPNTQRIVIKSWDDRFKFVFMEIK
jgi:hypothetical protein